MKTICHKFFQISEGVKFQNQNLWTLVAFTDENCFTISNKSHIEAIVSETSAVLSEHSQKNAGLLPVVKLGEMKLFLLGKR
jgi:hypothetical protein